ncbi:hypothetical protein IE81DRAFT_322057 [Ceraceosorus guamensis]|uniref:CBS domain-containing protein n=1 Tax=Ceraceosorus guamensis TaxID=1522189 RepID=A0A316W1K5_9BASI|nr:hypothetical protein IE81DRAFT_322057 [Ceraceosorus guamensis]PWN43660.1 hypothetical protein IE81DRAFT_322057 [Ceraceosorus guamensis]
MDIPLPVSGTSQAHAHSRLASASDWGAGPSAEASGSAAAITPGKPQRERGFSRGGAVEHAAGSGGAAQTSYGFQPSTLSSLSQSGAGLSRAGTKKSRLRNKDRHTAALDSIRDFLKGRSSYDVLPVSFRLVVLDTRLVVRPALDIMWQAGVVSAPLWQSATSEPSRQGQQASPESGPASSSAANQAGVEDAAAHTKAEGASASSIALPEVSSEPLSSSAPAAAPSASETSGVVTQALARDPVAAAAETLHALRPSPQPVQRTGFAGMLTVNDIIHLIQYYYHHLSSYDLASRDVEGFRLERLRDIEASLNVPTPPLTAIAPLRSLYEACQLLIKTHARRLPLLDYDEQTGCETLISVLTQYRVLKFIAMNCREITGLHRSVRSLGIGTYVAGTPGVGAARHIGQRPSRGGSASGSASGSAGPASRINSRSGSHSAVMSARPTVAGTSAPVSARTSASGAVGLDLPSTAEEAKSPEGDPSASAAQSCESTPSAPAEAPAVIPEASEASQSAISEEAGAIFGSPSPKSLPGAAMRPAAAPTSASVPSQAPASAFAPSLSPTPFAPLSTATLDTTVFDVVHMFSEQGISAVPIIDNDGFVVDLYESVDVIDLVRSGAYQSLDTTMRQALARRPAEFPGIMSCGPDDSLASIFSLLRTRRVHRLLILEPLPASRAASMTSKQSEHGRQSPEGVAPPPRPRGKLVGILCLSDILRYVTGSQEAGGPKERQRTMSQASSSAIAGAGPPQSGTSLSSAALLDVPESEPLGSSGLAAPGVQSPTSASEHAIEGASPPPSGAGSGLSTVPLAIPEESPSIEKAELESAETLPSADQADSMSHQNAVAPSSKDGDAVNGE